MNYSDAYSIREIQSGNFHKHTSQNCLVYLLGQAGLKNYVTLASNIPMTLC